MTAIEEERSLAERRKRSHSLIFEVQRHSSRPALRGTPLQHASDLGEPAVEFSSEFWKLRHQPLTVVLPDVCEALPPSFERAGQLRKLTDQGPPRAAGLPYFVAVDLRAVEQAAKTRQHLRGLSSEGFWARVRRITDCRREIVNCELAMSGREPTDCILKGFTGTGRPNQEPDQAVAEDTQRCFLGTSYNCLKIINRVGAASKGKERRREPGNIPKYHREVPDII